MTETADGLPPIAIAHALVVAPAGPADPLLVMAPCRMPAIVMVLGRDVAMHDRRALGHDLVGHCGRRDGDRSERDRYQHKTLHMILLCLFRWANDGGR